MDLILWRHAQAHDAEPGQDDLERPLTVKGRDQAKRMADWLRPRLPRETRILVSPALRTRQTADALKLPWHLASALAPHVDVDDLLALTAWPEPSHPLLLVGHQPVLGRFAATLLAGRPIPWTLRKGALFWLTGQDNPAYHGVTLKTVIAPDLL